LEVSHSENSSLSEIIYDNTDFIIQGSTLRGERSVITRPGFEGRHTLILLDGIPMNISGQSFDLSMIPVEIISKIEILETGSTEFGSGAIGAVINLKTLEKGKFQNLKLTQTLGSFGLNRTSITTSGYMNQVNYYLGINRSYTKNNFKYKAREFWDNPDSLRTRGNNDKEDLDIFLKLSGGIGSATLKYQIIYKDFLKKLPGPTNNPDLFKDSRLTGNIFHQQLNLERFLDRWLWKTQFYYINTETFYDNTRIEEPWSGFDIYYLHNRQKVKQIGIKLTTENGGIDPEIRSGISYNREYFTYEDLTDNQDLLQKSRENTAFWGNVTLKKRLDELSFKILTTGRLEKITGFNWYSTWQFNPEIKFVNYWEILLGMSIGNGLTLPSIYDLFWKGDTQTTGNPDLNPEKGDSFSAYLNFKIPGSSVKFSLSKDRISNKILWIPDFNKTWIPVNVGIVEVTNFEIQLHTNPFEFLSFNTILSNIEAVDKSKTLSGEPADYYGKDLIYTPGRMIRSRLEFRLASFKFGPSYKYTGAQWTTRDQLNDENKISDFSIFDVNVGYGCNLNRFHFNFQLDLKNITNTSYEIFEYSPAPGFNWEFNISSEIEF